MRNKEIRNRKTIVGALIGGVCIFASWKKIFVGVALTNVGIGLIGLGIALIGASIWWNKNFVCFFLEWQKAKWSKEFLLEWIKVKSLIESRLFMPNSQEDFLLLASFFFISIIPLCYINQGIYAYLGLSPIILWITTLLSSFGMSHLITVIIWNKYHKNRSDVFKTISFIYNIYKEKGFKLAFSIFLLLLLIIGIYMWFMSSIIYYLGIQGISLFIYIWIRLSLFSFIIIINDKIYSAILKLVVYFFPAYAPLKVKNMGKAYSSFFSPNVFKSLTLPNVLFMIAAISIFNLTRLTIIHFFESYSSYSVTKSSADLDKELSVSPEIINALITETQGSVSTASYSTKTRGKSVLDIIFFDTFKRLMSVKYPIIEGDYLKSLDKVATNYDRSLQENSSLKVIYLKENLLLKVTQGKENIPFCEGLGVEFKAAVGKGHHMILKALDPSPIVLYKSNDTMVNHNTMILDVSDNNFNYLPYNQVRAIKIFGLEILENAKPLSLHIDKKLAKLDIILNDKKVDVFNCKTYLSFFTDLEWAISNMIEQIQTAIKYSESKLFMLYYSAGLLSIKWANIITTPHSTRSMPNRSPEYLRYYGYNTSNTRDGLSRGVNDNPAGGGSDGSSGNNGNNGNNGGNGGNGGNNISAMELRLDREQLLEAILEVLNQLLAHLNLLVSGARIPVVANDNINRIMNMQMQDINNLLTGVAGYRGWELPIYYAYILADLRDSVNTLSRFTENGVEYLNVHIYDGPGVINDLILDITLLRNEIAELVEIHQDMENDYRSDEDVEDEDVEDDVEDEDVENDHEDGEDNDVEDYED